MSVLKLSLDSGTVVALFVLFNVNLPILMKKQKFLYCSLHSKQKGESCDEAPHTCRATKRQLL